jgi:hypothetical protein
MLPDGELISKFCHNSWRMEDVCTSHAFVCCAVLKIFGSYRSAGKSLARPERKQATATEGFDVHISYL